MRKLSYGWRLFATGFSFFSFGVGGLLLWALVFPVLSVLPMNPRLSHKNVIDIWHNIATLTTALLVSEK